MIIYIVPPMIVEIAIPELTLYPNGFPRHWLNILFFGSRAESFKIHAIVMTYVHLVEGLTFVIASPGSTSIIFGTLMIR
jgi:hypothetical protein